MGLVGLGLIVAGAERAGGVTLDAGLISSLVVAGVLAMQFPIHVNLSQKLSVASAVFFAAALLVPAWEAAAVVAGTSVVDTLISSGRRMVRTRERPPFSVAASLLFNSGQLGLSVLVAATILASGRVSARGALQLPEGLLVVAAAAAAMYAINLLLVATAVGLTTGRGPLPVFRNTHKVALAEFAMLYMIGAAAAFAAVRAPLLLSLGLLPAVLVYRLLNYRVALRHDSVLAMERMAEEVDRRDPYTFQHSQRVAVYSHAIARQLGLGSADVDLVELAAKVHDVGKIRIGDSVLLKAGALTAAERLVMETHPRLGFDILQPFSEYARVRELVLTHHERYDGKGYPNRILARGLPLIAQVIPVADSLDAMTSARAYRGAKSWGSAIDELRRGAGTQWNPQVVAAAVAVFEQEPVTSAAQPAKPGRVAVTA
ncbi:MAG TPA: HD domain-containing phosphohydrolase [Candidatus Dormibacteraeota bacterium]|nr:HD domain-containing phosphohydrolase [Candidatus Dormibacteraeota bacterium]